MMQDQLNTWNSQIQPTIIRSLGEGTGGLIGKIVKVVKGRVANLALQFILF